ncbi:hypothetical protein DXG03_009276 [Asterophora parasitica]|uniref:2-(3-amino-3-carboxypropyl)histidine synthase subunit 2 n=1 Tax=Asterophora parasitica TaxID=117018 RepID=A0A9P7G6D7_9AGAR|nr:hypothetical protein DXG03_009276 [Asterophora parasitica]
MSTENTAFSGSGEDAIMRAIDVQADTTADQLSQAEFDEFYEITQTSEEIIKGDYKRIALQFPDELLHDSVPIYRRLKAKFGEGRELYVLADTSYGRQAPAIPRLGIEVLYEQIATSTLPASSKTAEVSFCTSSQSRTQPDAGPSSDQAIFQQESSYPVLLYIGAESLTLTNLLMTHGLSEVFLYDPSTHITGLASGRTNRLLMRRYAAVQRARDADVFGILVGTLGVASYLPLIKHLRTLLARNRKKSYTISVGKLNPSKLANFLEIECFVLVACPENSVIEAKEFLRPIVTPFELEIALQPAPSWSGRYVLDFERLLTENARDDAAEPDSTSSLPSPTTELKGERGGEEEDHDQPVFSLVTGTYRHAKRYGVGAGDSEINGTGAEGDSAVVLRNQDDSVAKLADSAAGAAFSISLTRLTTYIFTSSLTRSSSI